MQPNKIYNQDCLEGMDLMAEKSVDAIICDLPYGTTRNAWDSVIPLPELWERYRRVLKVGGVCVLFAQTPFDKLLGASNMDWLKYEWIWEKDSGTGFLNANKAPLKSHENILIFYEKPPTYNPQMRQGFAPYKCKTGNAGTNYNPCKKVETISNGQRYPLSVLHYSRDANAFHPTQKPVDLVRYLVRTYTNEGDLVLDNCMGSGTTAVACVLEKRNFIGFELNQEYHARANNRLRDLTGPFKLYGDIGQP